MADSVAVLPALSFAEKVEEVATFLARQLPGTDNERQAWLQSVRESITTTAPKTEEGSDEARAAPELSGERKEAVVDKLVKTSVELNGGLEAAERDVESAHLVFQSLLMTDFEPAAYEERYLQVVESVGKGAAQASSRARVEAALRVLIHSYNLAPTSSRLRPRILLAALRVLSASDYLDVTALPLPIHVIEQSVSAWSLSSDEKSEWLQQVADVYESAETKTPVTTTSLKETALQLRMLALVIGQGGDTKAVDAALASALKIETTFDLVPVLKVQGVRDGMSGTMNELVTLFEEDVDLEDCVSWVEEHEAFLGGLGLSVDEITRKLRLLALVSLCAGSQNRDIAYSEVERALNIEEDLVEAWVIDAIHANLLKARLSQPKKTLRVQSVASRSFGRHEWTLLARRLAEWRHTIEDVQGTVGDAMDHADAEYVDESGAEDDGLEQQQGEEGQQEQGGPEGQPQQPVEA